MNSDSQSKPKPAPYPKGTGAQPLDARVLVESLFDSAPGAIVVADETGRIVRVNNETERCFGYTRAELIGQNVEIFLPTRFSSKHVAHRTGYVKSPRVRPMGAGIELFAVRKDGTEFPVDIFLGPLVTESGTLVLSIIHDITERRNAEREIKGLNKELELRVSELVTVNKELEAFSYSISHDLRAPLRAIFGFSRVLSEDYGSALDEEGKRILGVIQSNTQRMGELIDDLLAFSRLGRQGLMRGPLEMQELVRQVFSELSVTLAGRQVDFVLGPLPPAVGDRALMKQVLINLVQNAVKFTRDRQTAIIEVGGKVEGNETVYYVKDNGVGFEMQYAHKLFGVFQRLHRPQDFEGTGVGLAIVQRIVNRHGGRVWAESILNQGATFYFSVSNHQEVAVDGL